MGEGLASGMQACAGHQDAQLSIDVQNVVSRTIPLAKYEEASNRLRGRLLIFDELTSPPGLLLPPLLWEKCETE